MPARSVAQLDYYEEKAALADERALTAKSDQEARGWRHIAQTYRWISYHRRAAAEWRLPESGVQ